MAAFYRIVQERWASTAMDGEGARLYGGRWNPTGLSAVYLAESRALAALEILVHAPREALRLEWRIIKVEVPDDWIKVAKKLPDDWREQPTSIGAQRYGGEWLRSDEGVALRLPSVIIPQESSLLLNPRHINARELKISSPEVFSFDPRL
jgi:RES domain-containing protein